MVLFYTLGASFVAKVILGEEGYAIHLKKKLHIRRRHQQQSVTGLVVNTTVNLPRRTRRRLRAVAHHLAARRPATLTAAQLALSILRNFKADKAPKGFPISQIVNLFKPSSERSDSDRNDRMRTRSESDDWRVLAIEGMWFQDLWTYDFRRTEMCVIPYGTQEGEISFCAYNTGVGWRQIVENTHRTATLAEWHKSRGRHEIFAKGKEVPLATAAHSLEMPVLGNGQSGSGCCGTPSSTAPVRERDALVTIRSGE